MSDTFTLKIKQLTGEIFDIQVSKHLSVLDLKHKLGKMTDKNPLEIRLIYKAKSLNDDDDVVDYGKWLLLANLKMWIVNVSGETLHMVK